MEIINVNLNHEDKPKHHKSTNVCVPRPGITSVWAI